MSVAEGDFAKDTARIGGNAGLGKIFSLHGSFISSVISASFLLWLSYHSVLTLMSLPSLETTTVPFSSVR